MYGFKPSEYTKLPNWANQLNNYYWVLRVEKRNKAKVRRYYRLAFKEKLRLVEGGIRYEVIDALCKYLLKLDRRSLARFEEARNEPDVQLRLQYFDPLDLT